MWCGCYRPRAVSAQTETVDPASSHFVQELGFDVEPGTEVWTGAALVPPGACVPGSQFPLASTLLMYADVIAGGHARERTLPQLSVTVDLALDVVDPAAPHNEVRELVARSRILRGGKRMFFTETTLSADGGDPVAVCTGCFSAISRTLNAFGDAPFRRASRYERPLLAMSLVDRVGLVQPSPGIAEIARRADLGNSTDSLMGGLHSLLAERAALSRVEADSGVSYFVNHIQVRYLAPVRIGPARATVELVGGPPSRRVARVAVRDLGASGQLAADVTVSCAPVA